MHMKIKVVGFDPSTTAWGTALAEVDVATLDITIENLILTETANEKAQGVHKNSDDLRRAREQYAAMVAACEGRALAITEVPFFSPAAYPAANFNSGLVVGVLASCPIPLIQVFPKDVKIAAVGHHHACKEEMIEWAVNKFPTAPWRTRKLKGAVKLTAANEHLADACAVINAGIRTQQFQQALAMYRSMTAVAA
jgi:Holliday junction resolvasome RuvABC endonuclease subunit